MIADYVMKSIDSLFSDKLTVTDPQLGTKTLISSHQYNKLHSFNRDTIKKSLNSIIKIDNHEGKSQNNKAQAEVSPINKSRLKIILENNKNERIKSVVKRSNKCKEEASPYKKIEIDTNNHCRHIKIEEGATFGNEAYNKENDLIRYYRQVRKSIDKTRQNQKFQLKDGKKSRIFNKGTNLSHNTSHLQQKNTRY